MIKLPIPKPIKNEAQSEYISRCMSNPIMKEYEQKQRLAICYSTWRNSKRKRTTQETQEIIEWHESKFMEAKKEDKNEPDWVKMARRLLASKKGSPKLREYWKNRLMKYEASIK